MFELILLNVDYPTLEAQMDNDNVKSLTWRKEEILEMRYDLV